MAQSHTSEAKPYEDFKYRNCHYWAYKLKLYATIDVDSYGI